MAAFGPLEGSGAAITDALLVDFHTVKHLDTLRLRVRLVLFNYFRLLFPFFNPRTA